MNGQTGNCEGKPLRVVVTVRDCFVEVAVLPPGVEVVIRDFDAGVRMLNGTTMPLTCVYAREGKVELHERHR